MAFDPVSNPMHYAGDGKISCMAALHSMMSRVVLAPERAYWWGCAFKYLWRWPLKNGRKDLLKARQCIDYLLELPDGEPTMEITEDEREFMKARAKAIWEDDDLGDLDEYEGYYNAYAFWQSLGITKEDWKNMEARHDGEDQAGQECVHAEEGASD